MNTNNINKKIGKKASVKAFEMLSMHRFYADCVLNREFAKLEVLPMLEENLGEKFGGLNAKISSYTALYHALLLTFWANYLLDVVALKGMKYVELRLVDKLLGTNAYNNEGFANKRFQEYHQFLQMCKYAEKLGLVEPYYYIDIMASKHYGHLIRKKSVAITDLGHLIVRRIIQKYVYVSKVPVLPNNLGRPITYYFHGVDDKKKNYNFRKSIGKLKFK